MKTRKDFIKEIQKEGLSILKLHENLNKLNIEHEFINRKLEKNNVLNFINYICDFDYQIILHENDNEISLVQNGFSYGITENLIEVYNFQHEPVMLDYTIATELISKKKLNSYIIIYNKKNDEELEKIKEVLQLLVEREVK